MKTIDVDLADLKQEFDVRVMLDADHVFQLALLYESGVKMPPVEVTEDMVLIDGRHRVEAAKLANKDVILATVVPKMKHVDRIERAFRANVGGAKPPTKADIHHTINRLYDLGLTDKHILDRLPFPREVSRRYVQEVYGVRRQKALRDAQRAVATGELTVEAAALHFKVNLAALREALTGIRGGLTFMQRHKTAISNAFKGMSSSMSKRMRAILDGYGEGMASTDEVEDLILHAKKLAGQLTGVITNVEMRFIDISSKRVA